MSSASRVAAWTLSEIRYDLALTFLAARLAVWLVRSRFPAARSRGEAMTLTGLSNFLDDELASLIGNDLPDSA
jgi:hypothetical protein